MNLFTVTRNMDKRKVLSLKHSVTRTGDGTLNFLSPSLCFLKDKKDYNIP
jgi:hypothetical protein